MTASRGAIAGAANEAGGQFRAAVGVWFLAHGARGEDVPGLGLRDDAALPVVVRCEVSEPVDDIVVEFKAGNRALVQCKNHVEDLGPRAKGPFAQTVAQWCRLAQQGFQPGDQIVLATESTTPPIRLLAKALDRRRGRNDDVPTAEEQGIIEKASVLMVDLSEAQQSEVLHRAFVLILPAERETDEARQVAELLLDGAVVVPGQGRAAWRALRDRLREAAALRSGIDLPEVIAVLRAAHLTLVEDEHASKTAHLLAIKRAVEHHRRRLEQEAAFIDLSRLGSRVGRIPAMPGLLQVEPAHDPLRALRRRGRMLVLGPPGSGKSTLLRQMATGQDAGVLPLIIPLRWLLREGVDLEAEPIRLLADLATKQAPQDEAILLRAAIYKAAAQGLLTLFFDALDETQKRRFDIAAWIGRCLARLHPDCEVVVATRSSAFSAADQLGLRVVELQPFEATQLVEHVFEALSATQEDNKQGPWLRERMSAFDRIRDAGARRLETPLAATIIALLLAENPIGQGGRACCMDELLVRIACRWERHPDRNLILSGGLSNEEGARALLDAFEFLCSLVLLEPSEASFTRTVEVVAAHFMEEWGLPRGRGTTLAEEALYFWDEAGVLRLSAQGDAIDVGVRLLAELGAARHLVKRSGLENLLPGLVADETKHEVLALAAGLDATIAARLLEGCFAMGAPSACVAVVRGAGDGRISQPKADQIASQAMALSWSQEDASIIARHLTRLPVSQPVQETFEAWTEANCLPECVLLLMALGRARWRGVDAESLLAKALTKTVAGREVNRPPNFKAALFRTPKQPTDTLLDDAVIEAARLVKDRKAPLVEVIRAAARFASLGTRDRISRVSLLHSWDLRSMEEVGQSFRMMDQSMETNRESERRSESDWRCLLGCIANLAAPSSLGHRQARGLDELVAFLGVLGFGTRHLIGEINLAFEEAEDLLRQAFNLVASLGSFDSAVIAAQAKHVIDTCPEPVEWPFRTRLISMLWDEPRSVLLDDWPERPTLELALVARLFPAIRSKRAMWLINLAIRFLNDLPDEHHALAADAIAEVLDELEGFHRFVALDVVAQLDPSAHRVSEWRSSPEAARRAAAASGAARLERADLVILALGDDDGIVREVALRQLEPTDLDRWPELRSAVAATLESPVETVTCSSCTSSNPPSKTQRGCARCNAVLSDIQKMARNLLDGRSLAN